MPHLLALQLRQKDIEVVVVTSHRGGYEQFTDEEGVRVHAFFPWNLYWVGDKGSHLVSKRILWQIGDFWNFHTYRVIRQILAAERPDVVHVHKLRGLSPSVWAAARDAGVKTIVQTTHDFELMSPEGTLSGRTGRLAEQHALPMRPYQIVRSRMSRIVTHATAPSHFLLNALTDCGFFTRAQRHVIPNSHALATQELTRISRNVQVKSHQSPLNALYLGRLEQGKGVQLLLDAFTMPEIQQNAMNLNIAGWGSMETVVTATCDANPNMHFHGAVFGEKKRRLLLSADILIMPSLLAETFGIVIVEAFAYGVPVIASRKGAIPELVDDEQTGFLIEPGDLAGLVKKLVQLANDPTVLSRMRMACINQAQHYAVEAVTDQYLALY